MAIDVRASRATLPSTTPSSTTHSSPTTVPGPTVTWAPNRTSSPSSTSSPTTRPTASRASRSTGLSPGGPQRLLQRLEHADAAQAAIAVGARRPPAAHAGDEVRALDPYRLDRGHARAPDVARAGDVLAVGAHALVEALVVDGDLALEV